MSGIVRSKKRLFQTLLALFVTLAALVIGGLAGEIGLRLQRREAGERVREYSEQNVFAGRALRLGTPESLWLTRWERYKPNASLQTRTYDVRTNRFGYRAPEFTVEKPPGRVRILCIGASTTFQGSKNATTYPAVLEGLLRERLPGRDLEVLNLGISGTFSDYWLQDDEDSAAAGRSRVDRLLDLDPDLVIQYNGTNDLVRRYLERYVMENPLHAASLRRSFLLQRLASVNLAAFDASFDETLGNFGEIRRRWRERGVDYLVGSFARPDADRAPADFRSYLDLNTESWTGGALRYYREYSRLMDRFNDRLLTSEDLAPDTVRIHTAVTDPELFIDICHMNDTGIREMAAAWVDPVARRITERAE